MFETLRRLAGEGCTVLYISHKLEEIRVLCEKATVLRGGKVVATCDPRAETARSLAQMMIGAELTTPIRGPGTDPGAERLVVERLDLASAYPFGTPIRNVSLAVRAGEILGVAGVAGNGQSELLAALAGETLAPDADGIRLDGKPVGRIGPRKRRAMGSCFVPEERFGQATAPEMSLAENGFLSAYERADLLQNTLLKLPRIRSFAASIVEGYNVVTTGPAAEARSLSGGNLQKFVIGREILQQPEILIAAHPTWGRCRRDRGDPSGADRLGQGRRGGAGGLPGPRRAVRHQRPPGGDLRRLAVGWPADQGDFGGAGGPPDGRHVRRRGQDRRVPCRLG